MTSACCIFINVLLVIKRVINPNDDRKENQINYHNDCICICSISSINALAFFNCSYKIGAKCLANRLKMIISKLISPYQSAFVPGRQIHDSVLVAHEVYNFLKHKKHGLKVDAAIKLDLSKAYDRINWSFLSEVMKDLGFCDMWVIEMD